MICQTPRLLLMAVVVVSATVLIVAGSVRSQEQDAPSTTTRPADGVEHACLFLKASPVETAWWNENGNLVAGREPEEVYRYLGGDGERDVELTTLGSEVVFLDQAAAAGWTFVAATATEGDYESVGNGVKLRSPSRTFYFRRER